MTVLGDFLIVFGSLLVLLGAVGLIRFPDVLSRANAATKAATLGLGSLMLGAGAVEDDATATAKYLLAAVLVVVTSPVAGHLLGRAAYRTGAPLQIGLVDELEVQQDPEGTPDADASPPTPGNATPEPPTR